MSEDFPVPGGLAAGSRVAGYRVEEPLGTGGMAVVYRARDERLRRLGTELAYRLAGAGASTPPAWLSSSRTVTASSASRTVRR